MVGTAVFVTCLPLLHWLGLGGDVFDWSLPLGAGVVLVTAFERGTALVVATNVVSCVG